MNQQKYHRRKNYFASSSIIVVIMGILSFVIYIVGNMQFLDVYLFSLFASILGIVLGVVGLIVGFFMKEGKNRAIAGIALSAILSILCSLSF